jgi:hypothetical protein
MREDILVGLALVLGTAALVVGNHDELAHLVFVDERPRVDSPLVGRLGLELESHLTIVTLAIDGAGEVVEALHHDNGKTMRGMESHVGKVDLALHTRRSESHVGGLGRGQVVLSITLLDLESLVENIGMDRLQSGSEWTERRGSSSSFLSPLSTLDDSDTRVDGRSSSSKGRNSGSRRKEHDE